MEFNLQTYLFVKQLFVKNVYKQLPDKTFSPSISCWFVKSSKFEGFGKTS